MEIEPGSSAIKFDTALLPIELEALDVSAGIRFRQTDINLFWKTILGKSPSRRTIQATNPETVYYYYNPETKILKVLCREPLQIINHETLMACFTGICRLRITFRPEIIRFAPTHATWKTWAMIISSRKISG